MTTILYYFSGTGNSLATARNLAAFLGETELIPMAASALKAGEVAPSEGARIGFVFPVYYGGIPRLAAFFIDRVNVSRAPYVFGVVTAGSHGGTALIQLDNIMQEKGRTLDAGFSLKMPDGYVPQVKPPTDAERDRILAASREKLGRIADAIKNSERRIESTGALRKFFEQKMYRKFFPRLPVLDKNFSADDTCISCRTCERVCPAGNISIPENGKPVWHNLCEMCCACINFCPSRAIQYGEKTRERGRYHHPQVTARDMEEQHR
ncbi:MAG: EFR1 family ferrodoxin [Methanoregulaceae archaeon]